MIICIDGPAAAGKGTIAQELAVALNLPYLNSGHIYRTIAYLVFNNLYSKPQADLSLQPQAYIKLALSLCSLITPQLIDELSSQDKLDTAVIAQMSSIIASDQQVRKSLISIQRSFAQPRLNSSYQIGLVTDGRDMGTIIFPEAQYKFFLKANLKVRAHRRFLQLKHSGISYQEILNELEIRDKRDTNRTVSPLIPASDSIVIDCTFLSINETKNLLLTIIRSTDKYK